jgi:succinate dehydrogenase / fumarate reductase cytochrome b subunit
MAVTGFAFIGFVIGHLAGNLQIFISQDQFNGYAEFLHGLGKILWIERILIFLFFFVHIFYGIKLWFANKSSRPVPYARNDYVQASYSSRTMIWTGLLILFFVTYHLMHFTMIVTNPEYAGLKDAAGRFDVYSMVITGFSNVAISCVYILAMFFLAVHLSHALPSLFQTLGLIGQGLRSKEKSIGIIFAIIIFAGYVSIPVGVLLGIIELPGGGT